MKKLENILWFVIGAMVVVWLGIYAYLYFGGRSARDALISEINTIIGAGKKYKPYRKSGNTNFNLWGFKDFVSAAKDKNLPTEKEIEVLDKHRNYLREQYRKCLDVFVKLDVPIEKWFRGKTRIPPEEFDAFFKTEMDKLEKRLKEEGEILIAKPRASGAVTGLDYTSYDPSVMQKNFWIQAEIINALIARGNLPPRVWKLHYIKCGQWGARAGAAAGPKIDGTLKPNVEEAKYFDLIKVSFKVEMLFADVPVLLQRLMSSKLHFQPHALLITKVDIGNERDTLVIPDQFEIVRNGKSKVIKLPSAEQVKIRSAKIFPAVLPLVDPPMMLDFGKVKTGKTRDNIPTQAEMRREILKATLGDGNDYPFEEPPVMLEIFLLVRDLNYERMEAEKEAKEKDPAPAKP